MTAATSTNSGDHFALVTCMEARPGDGHPVIGASASFDSWARALVFANVAAGIYREILAARKGWWQFGYRVETAETKESHPTGDGVSALDVQTWKIATNRNDTAVYRVILALATEPLSAELSVDATSDLQTASRSISATTPSS